MEAKESASPPLEAEEGNDVQQPKEQEPSSKANDLEQQQEDTTGGLVVDNDSRKKQQGQGIAATAAAAVKEEQPADDNTREVSSNIQFVDHFSLGNPSSTIRFRQQRVTFYGLDNEEQFLLEEQQQLRNGDNDNDDDKKNFTVITVKRLATSSTGLRILRASYALVSLLVCFFLVAFCFQVVAFLFLNMAAAGSNAAASHPELDRSHVLAVIFSVPLHLFALSSLLAIASTFVKDTWKGNPLLQNLMFTTTTTSQQRQQDPFRFFHPNNQVLIVESICVVLFFVIPLISMIVTLLAKNDDWWEISAWVWIVCVLTFMTLFALLVFICEIQACLELHQLQHFLECQRNGTTTPPLPLSTGQLIHRAIQHTQTLFYSGMRQEKYLVTATDKEKKLLAQKTSWYSKMTLWQCWQGTVFNPLDPPERIYRADEIRNVMPFFTVHNWSLERIFCNFDSNASQLVFVQQGPGALRKGQVFCSMVFALVGSTLLMMLLVGFLHWNNASVGVVLVFVVLISLCCIVPMFSSYVRLYKVYNNTQEQGAATMDDSNNNRNCAEPTDNNNVDNGTSCEEEALFQVWERSRITEPTPTTCWVLFVISSILFFFWPLIQFFVEKNYTSATFFLILGGFSAPRLYLNPVPILRQMGSLDAIPLEQIDTLTAQSSSSSSPQQQPEQQQQADSLLRRKAKLADLVGKVNSRSTVGAWMWFFGVLITWVGIFCLAAFRQALDGFDYRVKVPEGEVFLTHDFYYPPMGSRQMAYPSCQLQKNDDLTLLKEGEPTYLMDVAYLATMSFAAPNESIPLINDWFGEGQVVDNFEFVDDYRDGLDPLDDTPVSFKLFSFPNNPGVALISIRGSESLLDWVVDVQLWLGAALAQIIRGVIPMGNIWNPVLDDLVYLINSVQSDNLKQVSYYRTTTKFINDLKSGDYGNGEFSNLRVTGASLGGGLALISGGQTNTTTIALSGLNVKLSRRTFDPPISHESINNYLFNVIPERDLIASIDDPGPLVQRTQCRAPLNDRLGCHSMWRTVCELSYRCGSNGRPVLCWCVSKYGYPDPVQNGTSLSFAEVCNFTKDKA